ncbi:MULTISPECIES: hypothetical protein [unclassified Arthrobacter]|uniref:hypothetical protein n=1 Tax=unclassified Arthrobacter TaxID=235627 RepID=UPI003395B4EA
MAKVRSPWRLLRPLLLAGAVTATWLTLSSSAATADSSTDSGSLLGGATSPVSSVSAPLAGAVNPLLEAKMPAVPAAPPTGLLQPVVGNVANTADLLVASVPVVKSVVPDGTVSGAAVLVAAATDGALTGPLEAAVLPLVEAVPILEPVVQPVAGLVTGATPLPSVLPGIVDPSVGLPDVVAPEMAAPETSSAVPAPGVPDDFATVGTAIAASGPLALAVTGAGTPSAFLLPAAAGSPLAEGPSPAPVPASPGSGGGSGSSASGSSGTAAWLNGFDLELPLSGTCLIRGASEHAPSPVSFDPGSSPD